MLTCSNCGGESPEDFAFCPACGASLEPAQPARETRKTVTVVFCDITGSTALGERLDPESLRDVQSRYFEAMRLAIERHGGSVEKFIGDAVMAVFGIPFLHEDDALRAVRAAVGMREAVEVLNADLDREWGVTIATRTGVNTGEVVSGDPSTGQVMVTGDAVNVAARLEQAAKPGEILIGEETEYLARDAIASEPLGSLLVKGKRRAFAAYRLVDVRSDVAGHRRRFDLPIVGRVSELSQMRREFERTIANRSCRLVTVLGAAGVGKSRMVREFLAYAQASATVLRGRCPPYGAGITYWPVKEALSELVSSQGDQWIDEVSEASGPEEAKRIVEQISAAIGPGQGTGSPDEIHWAIRRFVEVHAQRRPVVLVFEDLQWAETTFVDLILHMAKESTGWFNPIDLCSAPRVHRSPPEVGCQEAQRSHSLAGALDFGGLRAASLEPSRRARDRRRDSRSDHRCGRGEPTVRRGDAFAPHGTRPSGRAARAVGGSTGTWSHLGTADDRRAHLLST